MTLFVTDAELVRRLGIGRKAGLQFLRVAGKKDGFPQPAPAFGDCRFWPAVVQYLCDHFNVRPEFREVCNEARYSARRRGPRVGIPAEEDALGDVLEAEAGSRPKGISPYAKAAMASVERSGANGAEPRGVVVDLGSVSADAGRDAEVGARRHHD